MKESKYQMKTQNRQPQNKKTNHKIKINNNNKILNKMNKKHPNKPKIPDKSPFNLLYPNKTQLTNPNKSNDII